MSSETKSDMSYFTVFGILVVAFFLSIVLGHISQSPLAVAMIFLVAAVKAYLVLMHFVHLKHEPHFIKWLVLAILAALLILYVVLIPDIQWDGTRINIP